MRVLSLGLLALSALFAPASADEPPDYLMEWRVPGAPYSVIVDDGFQVFVTQIMPYLVSSYSSSGVPHGTFEPYTSPSTCTYPFGIAEADDGSIYVTMPACHRVQKFGPDFRYQFALTGFLFPFGVAVDHDGSVFVADTYNHRIKKFDRDGNHVLTWGSPGSQPGEFNVPVSLAVDDDGAVYVLDRDNQRVQIFDGDGTLIRVWGEPGYGLDHLNNPMNLAVDSWKNVYVADTNNNRIKKFDAFGNLLVAWGSYGYGPGQFITPHGVAVDDSNQVYVTDPGGRRIQKFSQYLAARLILEPRTLNIHASGRWMTGYITPPPHFQASQIEVPTLRLNGAAAVDPAAPITIADVDGDGVDELTVKFAREEVVPPDVIPGVLPVRLTGLVAGIPMAARDTITLVGGLAFERQASIAGPSRGVPAAFALHPVAPNPVRGSCDISLDVPTVTPVRLQVFDVGGRLRDTILDRTVAPGRVSVPFSAAGLPAGLYFVRMEAGGRSYFQRLIVVS